MLAYSFEHMHESENLMIGGSDSVSRTTNQCRQLDLNNESENGQLSAHRHIAYFLSQTGSDRQSSSLDASSNDC